MAPNCGQYTEEIHQVYSTLVRDGAWQHSLFKKISQASVFLGSTCQKLPYWTTDFIDWSDDIRGAGMKKIFINELKNSSIEQVIEKSKLVDVRFKEFFNHLSAGVKDWGQLKRLSIDEFSMHKGRKNL